MSRSISAGDPQTWDRALRFGQAVYAHRVAAGLTQDQLAEKAGCVRTTVSRTENAAYSPSLARIIRIADALGVDPAALFAAEDSS